MNTKSIDLLVKEAPEGAPGIIAYASTFDRIPDAYGDVIAPGAFKGTLERLKESGNNLPLLYGHVMDDPAAIIGTVTKAVEDDHGLLVEATFDMDSPNAQQVRRAVLSKAITKLSFAFSVLDQHTIRLDGYGEVNELTELEIYEVSLVVVPANPRAQVVEAKDATPDMKSDGPEAVDDTEPETVPEVKAEEPMEAKAEEPEEKAEEEEPETIPPVSEKEKDMDIETMESIATAQPAEKGLRELVAENIIGMKSQGRHSAATPEFSRKAFIPTPEYIPTVSRAVASPAYTAIAELFGQETISGNAYTFMQVSGGTAEVVEEGAAKPDMGITYEAVTLPLIKVAGIIKESDELLEDADWLVSAIEGRGVRALRKAKDGSAFGSLRTALDDAAITGDITEANLLAAVVKVRAAGYTPDAIIISPEAYASLVTASMANYRSMLSPDFQQFMGLTIVQYAEAGERAIVGAFKEGGTIVGKGGVRVEATNSDVDDFVHNLVTVRIEERFALAVRDTAAFAMVQAQSN